ncbi:hypothetical protein O6H91_23G069200 [Diphasiastrum complanatum]|uniref:Uncharacterized protein n=1 Tax=Diphasiastrum complanatum TaxID=34168 RepID=A0ACC2ABX4_DIPCM|nr:hypothetical protein O6H91_23G069200 [Diphasiastrum complanatum]
MFEAAAIAGGLERASVVIPFLSQHTTAASSSQRLLLPSHKLTFSTTRKNSAILAIRGARFVREAATAQQSAIIRSYGNDEASERQRLFNRIAPIYDNLNDLLSFGMHKVWKRMCVAWSRAAEGDTVLDVCCGSGDIALLLAHRVGVNGKVVGLDFSKDQLQLAMIRQHESPLTSSLNMEWMFGDALNLPFEEGTFDAVTVGYGLRNVADIPRSLKEIYRVLKPGSRTSVLDFNRSTSPPTRALQEWILDNVVVPVARQVGAEEEYAYLKGSISKFPTGKEQETHAIEGGFSSALHYEIAGGLMGVLVATK